MKKNEYILYFIIIYILLNMVLFPQIYINATLNGITAWAINVLPSLLPFVFFTKIITNLNQNKKKKLLFEKPTRYLFNTPAISLYTFFTSIISGYPVGAKMTADLYEGGKISKSEAFRMSSFCSTSGPMFIIGAVGVGMLKNIAYGYIIFFSHIIGAFINGIIYRNLKLKNDKKNTEKEKITSKINFSNIVLDSALSLISVGVIIAIFFVVITSLSPILNLFSSGVASFLAGLIEITKGCNDISFSLSGLTCILSCTFVISFGGFSTAIQSLTMLNKLEMPLWLFLLQKLTHAICSTLIALIIFFIFL